MKQAQELLLRVEKECKVAGFMLNLKMTKSMFLNVDVEQLKNEVGEVILQPFNKIGDQDFFYLESWCDKDRDTRTRKAQA